MHDNRVIRTRKLTIKNKSTGDPSDRPSPRPLILPLFSPFKKIASVSKNGRRLASKRLAVINRR